MNKIIKYGLNLLLLANIGCFKVSYAMEELPQFSPEFSPKFLPEISPKKASAAALAAAAAFSDVVSDESSEGLNHELSIEVGDFQGTGKPAPHTLSARVLEQRKFDFEEKGEEEREEERFAWRNSDVSGPLSGRNSEEDRLQDAYRRGLLVGQSGQSSMAASERSSDQRDSTPSRGSWDLGDGQGDGQGVTSLQRATQGLSLCSDKGRVPVGVRGSEASREVRLTTGMRNSTKGKKLSMIEEGEGVAGFSGKRLHKGHGAAAGQSGLPSGRNSEDSSESVYREGLVGGQSGPSERSPASSWGGDPVPPLGLEQPKGSLTNLLKHVLGDNSGVSSERSSGGDPVPPWGDLLGLGQPKYSLSNLLTSGDNSARNSSDLGDVKELTVQQKAQELFQSIKKTELLKEEGYAGRWLKALEFYETARTKGGEMVEALALIEREIPLEEEQLPLKQLVIYSIVLDREKRFANPEFFNSLKQSLEAFVASQQQAQQQED